MTIREIEAATGLPRANVRYYESLGLIRPARAANSYRDYRQEDLDTLLKIKLLRQLDCSLEDIQALEQGTRSLDQVLSQVSAALEGKEAQTQHALELCRKLQADRPSWNSLQPERYLFWNPTASIELPTVQDAVDDLGSRCPWRRYFARTLDYALCLTLWELFLSLVLRVNILSPSAGQTVLSVIMSLGLMCVLEAAFLHFFGTTPGKALFGLRLTRSDGSYFGYLDALWRTGRAALFGLGLMIPLLAFVFLILSFQRCRHQIAQPWALYDEAWSDSSGGKLPFWSQRGSVLRIIGYVGCYAAIISLTILGSLVAATPWHQGSLTTKEFVGNYNHLLTYASAPDTPGEKLGTDGTWYQTNPNVFVLHLADVEPPQFQLAEQDGKLTQVSFSIASSQPTLLYGFPSNYGVRTLHALLGERELLPGKALSALDQELREIVSGERTWNIDGWDITCKMDFSGYDVYEQYMTPVEGQAQELSYFFSAQFTGSQA